jgi:hypothetical protein
MVKGTSNLTNAIQRLLNDYGLGLIVPSELQDDISNGSLEIISLETIAEKINRSIRIDYWVDYYLSMGYSLYKPHKQHKYRLNYRLEMIDSEAKFGYKTFLYIENTSRQVIIGIFNHIDEMKVFLSKYYPGETISSIIYCNNDLTREYYKKQKYLGQYISKKKVHLEMVKVEG